MSQDSTRRLLREFGIAVTGSILAGNLAGRPLRNVLDPDLLY